MGWYRFVGTVLDVAFVVVILSALAGAVHYWWDMRGD